MGKKGIIIAVIILAVVAGGVMYFTKQGGGSSKAGFMGGNSTSSGAVNGTAGNSDKRAEFEQFREDHKFTFQFSRLVGNVGRLDKETDTPLTQDQAKKILAQLEPLRKAESMNQDEAKDNIKKLQAILTTEQRDNIAKMKERTRRFNGPGGTAGQARPSGQNGGQASPGGRQRGGFKLEQNFNPFNAAGNDRMAKRWDRFFDALKDRAAGKPPVKMTEEEKKAMEERENRGPGGPDGNSPNKSGGPEGGPGGDGPPPPPPGG